MPQLQALLWAVGGYDTVYCNRIAPGKTKRTCRQVGAHRKEKEKNEKPIPAALSGVAVPLEISADVAVELRGILDSKDMKHG